MIPNISMRRSLAICLMGIFFLGGCATTSQRLMDSNNEKGQVELRHIQSRKFETTDREKLLRTIIATLQDLEFVVTKADAMLGIVTGTKLKGYSLQMTVSIRPRGEKYLLVRANAQYNIEPIIDPGPYQDFYVALEKSMFLTAHQVD